MCQGFGHFSAFLLNFVLVKLGTSSKRDKETLTLYVLCNQPLAIGIQGATLNKSNKKET